MSKHFSFRTWTDLPERTQTPTQTPRVLHQEFGELGQLERAKRPERLPVVLAQEEVERLVSGMAGTYQLMAKLLYGTGMAQPIQWTCVVVGSER